MANEISLRPGLVSGNGNEIWPGNRIGSAQFHFSCLIGRLKAEMELDFHFRMELLQELV